jgi:hypothetical protein
VHRRGLDAAGDPHPRVDAALGQGEAKRMYLSNSHLGDNYGQEA